MKNTYALIFHAPEVLGEHVHFGHYARKLQDNLVGVLDYNPQRVQLEFAAKLVRRNNLEENKFILDLDNDDEELLDFEHPRYIYETQEVMTTKTEDFLQRVSHEDPSADVVIFYLGHAGKGHFSFKRGRLEYEDYAPSLLGFSNNILLVNAGCYSASCIEPLETAGFSPYGGGIIASAGQDQKSMGSLFLNDCVRHWTQGKNMREYVSHESFMLVPENEKGELDYSKTKFSGRGHIVERSGKDLEYLLFPHR